MHIVLINDDALPVVRGGDAVVVDLLRRQLLSAGHRVTLLTSHRPEKNTNGTGELRREDEWGTILSIPVADPGRASHRLCTHNPDVSPFLRRILPSLAPDIVHAHVIHQYITYECLDIAASCGARVFHTAHDTFLVTYQRVKGPRYERALAKGRPYRMHVWDHLLAAGRRFVPQRNRTIGRILQRSGTRLVTVSEALARFLRDNGYGATVIRNAIEPSHVHIEETRLFRERYRLSGPTILFGGRISFDKGIGQLLAAMPPVLQRIPAAILLIAAEEKRIHPHLAKTSEDVRKAVHVTGWLNRTDMNIAYAAADVVTTPSIYLDPFPTMNLEAMAAGKPVVGTCFGGTPESVLDGVTGFIRNPHDVPAFSDALMTLLENSALAKSMGEAGRKRVIEEFSPKRFLEAHMRLYGL
jgi:glycosyltransferase involved in cell wall biosynthesis